jgi:hypothetical protein
MKVITVLNINYYGALDPRAIENFKLRISELEK